MKKILEAVKGYQAREGLTDKEFAKRIGVDRSTWSYIKNGKRQPGLKFLRGVVRQYPRVKSLIDVEIYDNSNYNTTEKHQNKNLAIFHTIDNVLHYLKNRLRYFNRNRTLK